jgi:hypothetical protein
MLRNISSLRSLRGSVIEHGLIAWMRQVRVA